MKFVPWSVFIDVIEPSVRGAPSVLIMDAARSAAITLCENARIWSWTSKPASIEQGVHKYIFNFDIPARVVNVRSLTLAGLQLQRSSRTEFPYASTQLGRPRLWREEEPGIVMLWPVPDTSMEAGLQVVADLAPAIDATTCPEFLWKSHNEAIKYGALAEMTNIFGQAWANPQMSNQIFSKAFKKLVARARIWEERGGAAGAEIRF